MKKMETDLKIDDKPDYGLVIIKTMFAMTMFVFTGYVIFSNYIVANSITAIGTLIIFLWLNKKHNIEVNKIEDLLFGESLKKYNNMIQGCLEGDFKHSETLFENGLICNRFIEIYSDKRFMMEMLYNLKTSSIIECLNESSKIQNFIKKIFLDDFEKRLHYRIFLDKRTIIELIKKNVLHEILRNKVRRGLG